MRLVAVGQRHQNLEGPREARVRGFGDVGGWQFLVLFHGNSWMTRGAAVSSFCKICRDFLRITGALPKRISSIGLAPILGGSPCPSFFVIPCSRPLCSSLDWERTTPPVPRRSQRYIRSAPRRT